MTDRLIDGVYFDPRQPRDAFRPTAPALFLDRDGVIIELVDYLHEPAAVKLIPGAASALARFNRAGVPVIVVTNQSGIGRGYYDWDAFERTQDEVDRQLASEGAALDAVVACPFHADALPAYRHADHSARKPNAGMLRMAAEFYAIDLPCSWIVGDSMIDVETAVRGGLAGAVHVRTGYGTRDRAAVQSSAVTGMPVLFGSSIADVPMLLRSLLARV